MLSTTTTLTLSGFFTSVGASLALGLLIGICSMFRSEHSKGFLITLATLPAIVCVVIMMVSGSLGASVAVAGTFSLVRFRSAAGTAKEIGAIFLAMAVGLACGMGYVLFAAMFAVIVCAAMLVYEVSGFGSGKGKARKKTLQITVPENLDYSTTFDTVLEKYTTDHRMKKVKTTNLGSLFRLTYDVTMKVSGCEKQMIDELRCYNGNLEISLSDHMTEGEL